MRKAIKLNPLERVIAEVIILAIRLLAITPVLFGMYLLYQYIFIGG